jgi:hypothetical protein
VLVALCLFATGRSSAYDSSGGSFANNNSIATGPSAIILTLRFGVEETVWLHG